MLAGCLSSGPDSSSTADPGPIERLDCAMTDACVYSNLTGPIFVMFGEQNNAEPSIVVSDDAIVVTAVALAGDPRPASEIRVSYDDGLSWAPLPSLGGVQELHPGLEGDLAIDGARNLYFTDTYAGDLTFTAWSWSGSAWEWTLSRAVIGTPVADDRPWMAATGDGTVLILVNNGPEAPAPNNAVGHPSRWWLARSENGGLTWDTSIGFSDTSDCSIDAQRTGTLVFVACSTPGRLADLIRSVDGAQFVYDAAAFISHDGGLTFQQRLIQHDIQPQLGALSYPAAVAPSGRLYSISTAFSGFDNGGMVQTPVSLQWSDDGLEWSNSTVEINGTWTRPWLVSDNQTALLVYYWTADLEPSDSSQWFVKATTWNLELSRNATFLLDATPVVTAATPPVDFFQAAIDSRGRVHVVYDRSPGFSQTSYLTDPSEVMYIRLSP